MFGYPVLISIDFDDFTSPFKYILIFNSLLGVWISAETLSCLIYCFQRYLIRKFERFLGLGYIYFDVVVFQMSAYA